MKLPSEIYLKGRGQLKGAKWYEIQRAERALVERAEKAEKELAKVKHENLVLGQTLLDTESHIPRWILLSEQCPEEEGKYLVELDNGLEYNFEIFRWTSKESWMKWPVKRWMKMPNS